MRSDSNLKKPPPPPKVVKSELGQHICSSCSAKFADGDSHICDTLPWKLSGNVVEIFKELGAPIPDYINKNGVNGNKWEQELFTTTPSKEINKNFLGLKQQPQWIKLMFTLIFDESGDFKPDTDIGNEIDDKRGNLYVEANSGPFEGKSVYILKTKDLNKYVEDDPEIRERFEALAKTASTESSMNDLSSGKDCVLYLAGLTQYREKNFVEATAKLNMCTLTHSTHFYSHFLLAGIYSLSDRTDLALTHYNQVIELSSQIHALQSPDTEIIDSSLHRIRKIKNQI